MLSKLLIIILLGVSSFNNYAIPLTIHTHKEGNQSVYVLHAGAFAKEDNARGLQEKLTKQTPVPVRLKFNKTKKLYIVTIGPLTEYKQAQELRKQLSDEKAEQPIPRPGSDLSGQALSDKPSDQNNYKKLWNLKNADIRAVIAEVSHVTGKNFLIDPRVQGKVSIVSSTPINDKELYHVFLSMLQVSGYAAVPNGSTIKIVPNIDAKTQGSPFFNQLHQPPAGDEMLVDVIPVDYVPAEQLVPVLRPLMPQWSSVSAYAPSNMLILSGRANNIRRMAEIIRQVDVSSANGIDIVKLNNALAMDVANTLKDLVKVRVQGNNKTKTTIAPDDRSNSILISGSKTERIRLRLLINQLDAESGGTQQSNTKVYYLHYLRAEDAVPILAGVAQANFSGKIGTTIGTITKPALDSTSPQSSILSSGSSSSSSTTSGLGTSQYSSGSGSSSGTSLQSSNTQQVSSETEGSTKPTVQIIGEPNTNSIIINAPSSIISILSSVLRQIDIRPAQILIEAMVVEMNETDVKTLGIQWGTNSQTGNPSNFKSGFAIINSNTSLSDFQAQINALETDRKANILSTPSVVVLDNRQAKILVGQQVSVQSTSYPNNAGGTTGATPFTTFERVNVALHLYVRPQITRGSGIQMQIDQGNDTIQPGTQTSINPVFNVSSIVTSIHIDSGDVVVLGGLIQDNLGNDNNQIPIANGIPWLGRFFQNNTTTRDKKMLMVFIKPIILRNRNDAVRVSGGKYQEIRNEQLDYVRNQETYVEDDDYLVLDPLHTARLPIPFTKAKIRQPVMKKAKNKRPPIQMTK